MHKHRKEYVVGNDSQKVKSRLKETWHRMDGLYDFYAKSVGLNFTTIMVLQLLYYSEKNQTQKKVCEKLGLPKQFVNSIIKSFWEQGFVKLKEAKDRRNKEIIVTDKGKEYAVKILTPLEVAECAAWDSFTDDEILSLSKGLEKYAVVFEDILKNLKSDK